MPTELAKGVYWVGYVDWALRHFHGYELSTHRGSSYNAYLIVDEKIVLVDTVWGPFADRLIENIREIIDPAKIDIVVANHAEMDHSGGLPLVMQHTPNATVIVSKRGRESVEGHYHQPWNFRAVQTGERVNIGKRDLVFIEAPMLHWPDSMFTYVTGDNILISNDAFGHHYATANRFNDEVDQDELYAEAIKYYANILTPFSSMVSKKIDEVLALNLPVDMIAPSHGIIWRKDPSKIINAYLSWTKNTVSPKAVVLYETMWGSTEKMARRIADGLIDSGVKAKVIDITQADRTEAIRDMFEAKGYIIGSSTHDNDMLPTLAGFLEFLKGMKPQNRIAAAFGSYGWSGEGVPTLIKKMKSLGMNVIEPGVTAYHVPDKAALERCFHRRRRCRPAPSCPPLPGVQKRSVSARPDRYGEDSCPRGPHRSI